MSTASFPGMDAISYAYDGDGRRVKKTVGTMVTTFVYDACGELAAEYGGPANPLTGTTYMTADHLGSTRLVTTALGTAVKCYDYLPFGEEIGIGTAGRTSGCFGSGSYPVSGGASNTEFTSKERDAETGLDFFQARYYSSAQGRFTSPDEWAGGIVDAYSGGQVGTPGPLPYADITDPQTINKYAYVRNNPMRYTDPTGHEIVGSGPNGQVMGDFDGFAKFWMGAWDGSVGAILSLPQTARALYNDPKGTVVAMGQGLLETAKGALSGDPHAIGEVAGAALLGEAARGLKAPAAGVPGQMTAAEIKAAIQNSSLRTGQEAISAPMVNRYVKMTLEGKTPPGIKVDGNIIVDGNHRYAAGQITGKPPATVPGTASPSQIRNAKPFGNVRIDPMDWEH